MDKPRWTDRNWAEHDTQLRDNPTLEQAHGMGRTHQAYGWASCPWGHWTPEMKAAYQRGFKGEPLQPSEQENATPCSDGSSRS